jgi:hypothetical protein
VSGEKDECRILLCVRGEIPDHISTLRYYEDYFRILDTFLVNIEKI